MVGLQESSQLFVVPPHEPDALDHALYDVYEQVPELPKVVSVLLWIDMLDNGI